MPELRIDPLSGLKVIVAAERGDRPGAFVAPAGPDPIDPETDPFLEGHEDRTPPELYALREDGGAPDGPGWSVRVVPNLFPALTESPGGPCPPEPPAGGVTDPPGTPRDVSDPLASGRGEPDLFAARPAIGAHEVIVTAPEPVHTVTQIEPSQLETAMGVWRERMREHAGAAYVHVMINEGKPAGASLPHTHAQLYALPFVPATVARERERFTAYANRTHGRNLLEDLLQEEVRRRDRLVAIDDEAVALCPYASRVPFELQIVPRKPARSFADDGPLAARLMHEALMRLSTVLGGVPPLNLWVRTAPRDAERFCWRIDVLPRVAQPAGLELGAGVNLNPVAPERAAERLREAEPATA